VCHYGYAYIRQLANVFDDAPVCRRMTDESWAWMVTWRVNEMRVSKD